MGLLVGDHLQRGAPRAQEPIGVGQVVARLARSPSCRRRARRSASSVRRSAQSRLAAAEDQLLGLDEELDLADAAAAELQVVAGDGDSVMAAQRVDLALDRVDVGDGGEVEIARQMNGRSSSRKRCAERRDRRRRAAP